MNFQAAAMKQSLKVKTNVIIQNFLKIWISLFSVVSQAFSDNGREFVSDDFIDLCENINIKIITTAAEASWANSIYEQHNAILTNMLLKEKHDTNCSRETALALCAEKSLLPSIFTNKLPAEYSINKTTGENLATLYAIRKAFMSTKSFRKVKLAFLHYIEKQEILEKTFNLGRKYFLN